ncbi:MAG: nucleoside triphosphate pyrophosphohydrolase family protein [Bacteroidales bacterium]|nr:nucleoside triphosphate pyrophosphohydrolase family protein [Bacteroidales bacterium]
MTLNEYQKAALATACYPKEMGILYPVLGLSGETGEVADKIKKVYRDLHGEFSDEQRHAIALELGDVMWYCASLAHDLGYTLDDIAQMNISKLASRLERNVISGNGDNR